MVGIDDEDDSTFTVTVDNKTFHFQVQLDIYQETGAGAGWSRGPFFAKASLLILLQPVLWIQVHWIQIRIQNFGPIEIRIQGYVNNIERIKCKKKVKFRFKKICL